MEGLAVWLVPCGNTRLTNIAGRCRGNATSRPIDHSLVSRCLLCEAAIAAMAAIEATAAAEQPPASRGSFKLRFAAHGEPGRSNLSAIRPLGLPAPVTDKLGARAVAQAEAQAEARALALVQARFARGPRDLYAYPVTTTHEYGWWCVGEGALGEGVRGAALGRHHIRDSGWLRARLRLLAPDAAYKRR